KTKAITAIGNRRELICILPDPGRSGRSTSATAAPTTRALARDDHLPRHCLGAGVYSIEMQPFECGKRLSFMRKTFLLIALAVLSALPARAANIVAPDGKALDHYMLIQEAYGFSGAVLVAHGNQVLLVKGYGL